MLDVLIGSASGLVGVVLGWLLHRRGAAEQLIAEGRRQAAGSLMDALVSARQKARVFIERRELVAELKAASDEWYGSWLRHCGQIPADLADRLLPIHDVLFLAQAGGKIEARNAYGEPQDEVDLFSLAYVVERAFRDAFAALDAFLLDRPLPVRSFPGNVMEIATDEAAGGDPVLRLRAAINDYPEIQTPRSRYTRI